MYSETSQEALQAVKPKLRDLQEFVLDTLKSFPNGATDEQLIEATGLRPNTCRPRRIELVAMGLIRNSGDRGITSSGRKAILWKVV